MTQPQSRWTRQVVLFMIASFASAGGVMGVGTLLGLHVYDITHREFDLGLVGIAQFAPALVLVLLTGSVADRYDRARVFAWSSLGQAAALLVLAWYATTDPTSAVPIFGLVVGFGVFRAFTASAQGPLMADVVPGELLPWLIPRRTLITRVSGIGAPILAGALFEVDPVWSYIAVATFLVVAAIAAALIPRGAPLPPRDGPATSRLHEALEGFRFIRRSPVLAGAITIDLFAVLFGGAVALLPALAEDRLGVDGTGVGILRGAGGVGSGLVALVLAWRPIRRRVGKSLIGAVAVFGLGTMVLGVTRHFAVALAAMIVLSAADSVSVFIRQALVPLMTPRGKLGRVSALSSVSIGASNELGAFESGVAGELLGSSRAIILGGVATLAVAGTYLVVADELRRFDRFPTSPPEDDEPPDAGVDPPETRRGRIGLQRSG